MNNIIPSRDKTKSFKKWIYRLTALLAITTFSNTVAQTSLTGKQILNSTGQMTEVYQDKLGRQFYTDIINGQAQTIYINLNTDSSDIHNAPNFNQLDQAQQNPNQQGDTTIVTTYAEQDTEVFKIETIGPGQSKIIQPGALLQIIGLNDGTPGLLKNYVLEYDQNGKFKLIDGDGLGIMIVPGKVLFQYTPMIYGSPITIKTHTDQTITVDIDSQ